MPSVQDYLDIFSGVPEDLGEMPEGFAGILAPKAPPTKAEQLSEAARRRQQELGRLEDPNEAYKAIVGDRQNNGQYSQSEEEWDFANLSPNRLAQKYGVSAARRMNLNRLTADTQYRSDFYQSRDRGGITRDSVFGVAQGFSGLLGLGALGVGLVSDEAGAAAAQTLNQFNKELEAKKTRAYQGSKRVQAAQSALISRDARQRYAEDIEDGLSEAEANFRMVGREVLDNGYEMLANPLIAGDIVSQAAGSLGGSVALGKLASALGNTSLGSRIAGVGGGQVGAAASTLRMPAAIAAQESGGIYQQTTGEAMDLLVGRDDLTEEQKAEIANEKGLRAAAIMAPIAAATGRMVSAFESAPLRSFGARGAAKNIVKETAEESTQGAAGQLVTNMNLGDLDPDRLATEGVAEAIAAGALGGFGSTAVTQGVGTAARVPTKIGDAAIGAGATALAKGAEMISARVDKLEKIVRENAPLSGKRVRAEFTRVAEKAPAIKEKILGAIESSTVADDVKNKAREYIDRLTALASVEKLDQVETLAAKIAASQDEEVIFAKTKELQETLNATEAVLSETVPDLVSEDIDLRDNRAVMQTVRQSQPVQEALGKAATLLAANPVKISADPLTDGSVEKVVTSAEVSPLNTDSDSIDIVLKQADEGGFTLTPRQRASLLAARALLDASKASQDISDAFGITEATDAVSREALTGEKNEGRKTSGVKHMQGILGAMKAGNVEEAQRRFKKLQDFAQAMQNKLAGVNAGLATPGFRQREFNYETVNPRGEWFTSKLNYTPGAPRSVGFVQQIAIEAAALGQLANRAAELFPELGAKPIKLESLDPRLIGEKSEIAVAFREGNENTRVTPTEAADTAQPEGGDQSTATTEINLDGLTDDEVGEFSSLLLDAKFTSDGRKKLALTPAEIMRLRSVGLNVSDSGIFSDDAVIALENERASRIQAKAAARKEAEAETVTPKVEETTVEETEQDEPEAAPEPAQAKPDTTTVKPADESVNVFEDLLDDGETGIRKNWFRAAFKRSKNSMSRLYGLKTPFRDLFNAMANRDSVEAFMGGRLKTGFSNVISQEYQTLVLDIAKKLDGALDARVQEVLDGKADGTNTRRDALLNEARAVNRNAEGKILNLLVPDQDGNLSMQQQLKEAAILAAIQWAIAGNVQNSTLSEDAAAAVMGVRPEQVDGKSRNALAGGMTLIQAVEGLTRKIEQYWGLSKNNSVPLGYTKGIPEHLAKHIIDLMQEQGLITMVQETLVANVDGKRIIKKPYIIRSNVLGDVDKNGARSKPSAVRKLPDLIDRMVLKESQNTVHIGEPNPNVSRFQLRNKLVRLSSKAIAALENESRTPHTIDTVMSDLVMGIKAQGAVILFGEPDANPDTMNKIHYESVSGQNRVITAGWSAFVDLLEQIANYSSANGNPAYDAVPVFYDHEYSSVNRMQTQGDQNSQANKVMRELILPTHDVLDLTNRDHRRAMYLAVGQALGQKIETQSYATTEANVIKRMAELPRTQAIIGGWLDGKGHPTEAQLRQIRAEFGGKMSPVQLHAIVDMVRATKADEAGRKSFKTSLYLEADGVTNGPINAIHLFDSGKWTEQSIENRRRGGQFIGNGGVTTTNEYREGDTIDLYQTAASALLKILKQLYTAGSTASMVKSKMDDMFVLTSILGIKIDRILLKNPLTITVYGSGPMGIAGKVAGDVMDRTYQLYSKAAKNQVENPGMPAHLAMFGDVSETEEQAKATMEKFQRSLNNLTRNKITYEEGRPQLEATKGDIFEGDSFLNLVLTNGGFEAMQTNLLVTLVNPMVQVIKEVMGEETLQNTTNVRRATQVQSIIAASLFKKMVNAKLTEAKKDPNFRVGDFISQSQLDEINQELVKKLPFVEQAGLTFHIWGSGSTTVADSKQAMSKLIRTDKEGKKHEYLSTDIRVQGAENAKVAGIPYLTIGLGDGVMMTVLATMDGRPEGTLKVFDGMHMRLSKIFEDAPKVNQAANEAWQGNPMRAVAESFKKAMPAILDEMGKLDKDNLSDFLFAMDEDKLDGESITGLLTELETAADALDAKQKVLQGLQVHVDQMAGAGVSFTQTGEDIGYTNAGEQARILNARMGVETEEKAAPVRKAADKSDAKDVLGRVGRVDRRSGARVLSLTSLKTFYRAAKMTEAQRSILNDVLKTTGTNGYTVVFGTRDQLERWSYNNSRPVSIGSNENGLTHTGTKTIYLVEPSSEILIHELLHAATLEKVMSYYQGKMTDPSAKAAIQNIEQLMEQFLALDPEQFQGSLELRKAYRNAIAQIRSDLNNPKYSEAQRKAAALNEFMAYNLSSAELIEVGSKTEVTASDALRSIARSVIDAVRKLLWGKRSTDAVLKGNLFTSLRLSNGIIMAAEQDAAVTLEDTILYQADAYGNSDRLVGINQIFQEKIGRYGHHYGDKESRVKRAAELKESALNAQKVRAAFAGFFKMSMQEATTFDLIMATMGSAIQLDANALTRTQEMLAHVEKHLTPAMFMPENPADPLIEEYYAQQKYKLIFGKLTDSIRDGDGRPYVLPAFLAMATVNEEFRGVLRKMPVPTKTELGGKTLDEKLENLGSYAMDSLTNYLSGDRRGSKNVQDSVDNLMNRVVEVAADRQSFLERVTSPIGRGIDWLNDAVVSGVEKSAAFVADKTKDLAEKVDNKAGKATLEFVSTVTALVDEDKMEVAAQGFLDRLYRNGVWTPFAEFISDIVGRNSFNGNLLDMIKLIRSGVQQVRQQYREKLPDILEKKFKRQMEDKHWTALYKGVGQADLAALVQTGKLSFEDVRQIVLDDGKAQRLTKQLEDTIQREDPVHHALILKKAQQLAKFSLTGIPGVNLLRNAFAIGRLAGELSTSAEKARAKAGPVSNELIAAINQVATLYAIQQLDAETKATLVDLAQNEAEGFNFSLAYTVGQRKDEIKKANKMARMNHYKGYIPGEPKGGISLVVRPVSEEPDLIMRGYIRVATYQGSSLDSKSDNMAYYFAPVSARAPFQQGLVQNVHQTAGGVDVVTGQSHGVMTAGIIRDPTELEDIAKNLLRERGKENLLPIYDEGGNLVGAERSLDPTHVAMLENSTHFGNMLGAWHGRQIEEIMASQFNRRLIEEAYKYLDNDKIKNPDDYYDLFRPSTIKDPIIRDAAKLITPDVMGYAEQIFGDKFLIPKALAKDFLGYRAATVGDMWTGNTRWNSAITKQVRDLAISVFGTDAYKRLVNAEQLWQNIMTDARLTIVVKSVVVPMVNLMSNMLQLKSRGVPMSSILRGIPKKAAEVDRYIRTRLKLTELEAELRAVENEPLKANALQAQIEGIKDIHTRLSIWPLIESGEFASISDVGISQEEVQLSSGRLNAYIEGLVDKLPDSVRNAGRYAWITRDTALFRGLQRAVEYGDFLAKAVLYDDLINRKKESSRDAMAKVSQEYVNYDILPGRTRGYLERMGLLWFWTFKIRSMKIAASIVRNNPVHALMASIAPMPDTLGTVGSPMTDNFGTVLLDDRLHWSMGIDQGLRAPSLNPWWNMTT